MIYFTADTHLGHKAILQHCPYRGEAFGDLHTMNKVFIDSINNTVGRSDTLYHLGDFCWSAAKAGHYRQRINCRKIHIIRGNHDSSSLKSHFSSMNHMVFLKNPQMHLCHYPILSWGAKFHGGYHLHGHCHARLKVPVTEDYPEVRALDVGVDSAYRLLGVWRPFSLDEIVELLP